MAEPGFLWFGVLCEIISRLMRSTLAEAFSPVHKDTVSCRFSSAVIHLGSNIRCLGSVLPDSVILPTWQAVPHWKCARVILLHAAASSHKTGLKIKAFETSILQLNLTGLGQQAKR